MSIDDILNTPEKRELYKTDPTYNACIKCILRGQDPLELILTVCNQKKELQQIMENFLTKYPINTNFPLNGDLI